MRTLPETELTKIGLFGDGVNVSDDSAQILLCAPMSMYDTRHYHSLVQHINELHPHACVLLAHTMYFSKEDWRETYRWKISQVSVCYALTDLRGYIGAGQFAELAAMTEPARHHPIQKLIAVRSYLRSKHPDNLEFVTSGSFDLREYWNFWECAELKRLSRSKSKVVSRASKEKAA